MMQIYKYSIGHKYTEFTQRGEGVFFDFSEMGASLVCLFRSPQQYEIDQYQADKPFEIRLTMFEKTMILTAKMGRLKWVDAPYTPRLSEKTPRFKDITPPLGYALTLLLADSQTGELKTIRLMGLSNVFSNAFNIGAKELITYKVGRFVPDEYYKYVASLYSIYTTEQIASMATAQCKIEGIQQG